MRTKAIIVFLLSTLSLFAIDMGRISPVQVDTQGGKITNLADGTVSSDAATWGQVQVCSNGVIAQIGGSNYTARGVVDGMTNTLQDQIDSLITGTGTYYLASNPSNYVDQTVTNGLLAVSVAQGMTNQVMTNLQAEVIAATNNYASNVGDALYQPLESTLTDVADGTIVENLINTNNPWADNEVTNALTVDEAGIAATITRDSEWDTLAEINAASTDTDAVLDTDIGSTVQAHDVDLDQLALLNASGVSNVPLNLATGNVSSNRLTNVLDDVAFSGEADTLQTVADRGATTTNNLEMTGRMLIFGTKGTVTSTDDDQGQMNTGCNTGSRTNTHEASQNTGYNNNSTQTAQGWGAWNHGHVAGGGAQFAMESAAFNIGSVEIGIQRANDGCSFNIGTCSGSSAEQTASGRSAFNIGDVYGNNSKQTASGNGAFNLGEVLQGEQIASGNGAFNIGSLAINEQQVASGVGSGNFGTDNSNVYAYAYCFGAGVDSTETNAVFARKFVGALPAANLTGNIADTRLTNALADFDHTITASKYDDAGTARVNIDDTLYVTNSQVGIGTNIPAKLFHVAESAGTLPALNAGTMTVFQRNANAGEHCIVTIIASTNGSADIYLGDEADENAGAVSYDNVLDELELRAGGASIDLRILSDGGIQMPNLKTGTNQTDAGASASELWADSDDDYSIKFGQ